MQSKDDINHLVHRYLEPLTLNEKAFFTGYYEPTLQGSLRHSEDYPIPLYTTPNNKKQTRKAIRDGCLRGQGLELVYVRDDIDAFFLEIQGSGRVELDDGKILRVGYADQNGYPFTPIGRILKERGEIDPNEISLRTIKQWLRENPDRAHSVMNMNESYVFFKAILQGDTFSGPIGTQKQPLTPLHSLACDPSYWPFGMLFHYRLRHPRTNEELSHMALTQDTGGAIKGPFRFDLFCGYGRAAEDLAGHLKDWGKMTVFLPKKSAIL